MAKVRDIEVNFPRREPTNENCGRPAWSGHREGMASGMGTGTGGVIAAEQAHGAKVLTRCTPRWATGSHNQTTNSTRSSPSRWRTPVCPRSWAKAATTTLTTTPQASHHAGMPDAVGEDVGRYARRSMSMVWRSSGRCSKTLRGEEAGKALDAFGYLRFLPALFEPQATRTEPPD